MPISMIRSAVFVGLALVVTGEAADPPADRRVDLRPTLRVLGLEPRLQGSRGTCSAFVVTQAIEYAAARGSGSGERLSVEYLNWASNEATGNSDDGGFFSDLWAGFARHGICSESTMPYAPSFDARADAPEVAVRQAQRWREAGLQFHWIKPWDVSTGLTESHLDEIKATLRRRWPVCAGLRWPKAEKWNGDLLQMAPPDGVRDGHSVLVVGYEDDPDLPGGGALVFRNSANGGRDGRMTYEYARAYMNDAAWIDDGAAAPVPPSAGEALLNPLSLPPAGRNRRVSSNMQPGWHDENLDMTWLQPGQSVQIPVLAGPGVITHMWFTSHAGWVGELNALSIRIYWDGREQPGVEAPLGDFFAIGQGKPEVVESIPVQVSTTGSLSSYWRMPFRESARIVVTNDNPDRGAGLYWQVDWMQLHDLAADTPYFHAKFRREFPARAGDYALADLAGRGLYVGTVMSVTLAQDGWFGEGDDFFCIDGEAIPSLQGTGSEDYFNDAWGFRPRTSHWFGSPRWQGDSAGDSGVCYRWHLPDPVRFTTSLKATIEHKGNRPVDTEAFYIERPDFLSSVAFWYQEDEPKAWPPLPGWHERRVPWERHHFVQAFKQVRVSGGTRPGIDTSGLFGARPMLVWEPASEGEQLSMPFEVRTAGRFAARLVGASGPARGRFEVRIDGSKVADADFAAVADSEADLAIGTIELAGGPHAISIHAGPGRGSLGIELLKLLSLPPEANRQPKTHHEAHFIRLGIGRALYAYRLAYGRLPDSLESLVQAGIMPERYLRDENDQPLRSRREGDSLIVESTSGEAWTHRWQGLDPRR